MRNRTRYSKKNTNITFLLTQDIESPSGLGRYFPLSKNLVKQGFSVSIAALHPNFKALDNKVVLKDGVKISYVAQMHVMKEENQTKYFKPLELLWLSVKATWGLLLYLFRNSTEIVVIGKPHPMNSIAGLLGGWLVGSKIVLDCDDYEAASNYFSSSWQRWVIIFFEDTMPKLVHKVVTNTTFNKNRMVRIGVKADKIQYLPNGVDSERFLDTDECIRKKLIENLNIRDKNVIAYIGSLSLINHPVDLLIRAFKEIVQKTPNAILLIVGGGKDIEKLEYLVNDFGLNNDVIFIGRVSPDTVPYYYAVADITVDPVYDNDVAKGRCPLKMFESWAMKTPFITADVGDRKTIAGSPPAALFFESGDPINMASKIIDLLNNEEMKENLCVIGFKLVQNYKWSSVANEFIKGMKY